MAAPRPAGHAPLGAAAGSAKKQHTLAEPIGAWWHEDFVAGWHSAISGSDATDVVREAKGKSDKEKRRYLSKVKKGGDSAKAKKIAQKAGTHEEYTKAINLEPSKKIVRAYFQGRANIARAEMHKGRKDSPEWKTQAVMALTDLNIAIQFGDASSRAFRADIYSQLGFQEAALADVAKGEKGAKSEKMDVMRNDLLTRLNYTRAVASYRSGDKRAAIEALEAAAKTDKRNDNLKQAATDLQRRGSGCCACCGGAPTKDSGRTLAADAAPDDGAGTTSSSSRSASKAAAGSSDEGTAASSAASSGGDDTAAASASASAAASASGSS